jgi:L,D-peptidoglycan transpeptidase YkuD (ErfK/YbiS/YcfS/YnhG family)
VRYRPDRLARPHSGLDVVPLTPDQGWCDAPSDPAYNRLVKLPYGAGAETLWREDGLYDLLAVIGHNDDPPQSGAGSAIFLHVAREPGDGGARFAPTQGCVALALADLVEVLALCDPKAVIDIGPI